MAGIEEAVAARRRAQAVAGLRGLAKPGPRAGGPSDGAVEAGAVRSQPQERCDICQTTIPTDHRHLLQLVERRIECVCESCWARHSGDVEYRPTGSRTLWLADLQLPDELWASFQIPIGLTFLMQSSTAGCVVALYPSPAGATESELHFSTWAQMVELNPILAQLESDVEGLIINRLADPPEYVIVPIDRCYELTGTIKVNWQGLSGGPRVEGAVASFFADMRARAMSA